MIQKILIANRGEIALRIQRTAKKMGIKTVAVYGMEDTNSAFVENADETVLLEGSSLGDTYLNIEKIIAAAKKSNADAIHPGYGFLSENAAFVKACEQEQMIFIGPSVDAMQAMGNKIDARQTAVNAGVPITPGITGTVKDLLKNYEKIGLPILIKAAAGGGGKGMRVVQDASEIKNTLETTAREARNYFGDETVYIEKYIEQPRHIEVQILGDRHGNLIHLYERECSLQRRHQKIIEEAPSITLAEAIRNKICDAALSLAKSIGYYSAGTMEFLVDETYNFYFLEMNTRIQVEHPVTELTTDVDIVEQQIKIANGEKLILNQENIPQNGHAIECRIYAEDPEQNFLPSPGIIKYYKEPMLRQAQHETRQFRENLQQAEDTTLQVVSPFSSTIRIDGMELKSTDTISGDYDPMIAKLIVWAPTREQARLAMLSALYQYQIKGIKTNIEFLITLLQHDDYINNHFSTKYLDNHLPDILDYTNFLKQKTDIAIPLAAALIKSFQPENMLSKTIWNHIGYWRLLDNLELIVDDKKIKIHLEKNNYPEIIFQWDNKTIKANLKEKKQSQYTLIIDEEAYDLFIFENMTGAFEISYNGLNYSVRRTDISNVDEEIFTQSVSSSATLGNITSPMPGKVIKINVQAGDTVKKGDTLLIVEAMKMENNIISPADAIVDKVLINENDKVDVATRLIELSAAPEKQS